MRRWLVIDCPSPHLRLDLASELPETLETMKSLYAAELKAHPAYEADFGTPRPAAFAASMAKRERFLGPFAPDID